MLLRVFAALPFQRSFVLHACIWYCCCAPGIKSRRGGDSQFAEPILCVARNRHTPSFIDKAGLCVCPVAKHCLAWSGASKIQILEEGVIGTMHCRVGIS